MVSTNCPSNNSQRVLNGKKASLNPVWKRMNMRLDVQVSQKNAGSLQGIDF